jgi:hypothetical protein
MIYYVKSKLLNDFHSELTEYVNSHLRIAELWGQKQLNTFIKTIVFSKLYKNLSTLEYLKII